MCVGRLKLIIRPALLLRNVHPKRRKLYSICLNTFQPFRWKMSLAVDKVDSPEFKVVLSPELLSVAAAFENRGYDLRIVGGAVRDILLGIHPKDVDLGTNATPEQMIQLFKENNIRYIETGLQHGTITAHLNNRDFEVTTLRIDKETDGRHAKVEFTNDWRVDAERRDLTINAMSLGLDGTLYDYFGGEKDLVERRVRFVGDPRLRIQEDYLRILRYFRFYGRIVERADSHDPETLTVIRETSAGLKSISVERIWMEMSKILTGNHTPSLIRKMYELNVSRAIGLPDFCEQKVEELTRAWKEHRINGLQSVTLLCSLVETAQEAENLAKQWKLSNAEKLLGRFTVEHREPKVHEHPLKPYQDMIVSTQNARAKELLKSHIVELLHYQGRHGLSQEIQTWSPPLFPVTGSHLKTLGINPGPEFGKMLSKLREIWKDGYFTASKEDLLDKARLMKEK